MTDHDPAVPASPSAPRTIYANLFVESTWSRLTAIERKARRRKAPSPLDPRFMPSDEALERSSALGTLLRVMARKGDWLWLPKPVDPARMTDVPGIERPELLTGARATATANDVMWGDPSEAGCQANDRRFCLELRTRLGCPLPGSAAADWIDDAVAAIAAASAQSSQKMWIAKAVHSAAGRSRVIGRATDDSSEPDDPRRRALTNLIELHGAVVVEPWLTRTGDFGATWEVTREAADADERTIQFHDVVCSPRGDFRGITVPTTLRESERDALRRVVVGTASALREIGYFGPFGIDAFRWTDAAGVEQFHPLCEINARLSFGRIAHELAARLATPAVRLRLGSAADLAAAPSPRVLLAPGAPDGCAAWLE